MSVMSDELHSLIVSQINDGDALATTGRYVDALTPYHAAWEALPEPKESWEAATTILVAIGDAHFFSNAFLDAIAAYQNAIYCPDGLGNPYIHLRLGESLYEVGEVSLARDELTRAYMGAGSSIFDTENSKYFDCIKSVLEPPSGSESL